MPADDKLTTSGSIRSLGLACVVLAIFLAFSAAGVSLRGLIWVLCATGTLIVGEYYRRPYRKELTREDVRHGLLEVGLLIASAVVFFWILHPMGPPGFPDRFTVNFSDNVEKGIVAHVQRPPYDGQPPDHGGSSSGGTPPSPTGPITLKLSDRLEDALTDFLKRASDSAVSTPPLHVPLISFGALALAAGLLFFTLKKRGEKGGESGSKEVSLAALTTIITAVLGALQKLPPLRVGYFRAALLAPSLVAICLGVAAVFAVKKARQTKSTDELDKAWQYVATGLSFGLLSWLALWASATPVQTNQKNGSGTAPAAASIVDYQQVPIKSKLLFAQGSADIKATEPSIAEIQNDAKPEDLLVLVGSTDCSKMKIHNDALAARRADGVEQTLGKIKAKLISYVPPQHESCKPDANLRAVFPILLR